ncbi:MAG: CysB family transcriptional regulator [Lysobacteraceae bacterium]|nr:MAG: CysB family transcriptional regulator [Xanthomonadaceae bacterium]
MKLQQLRFFKAVVDNDLNISAAADALYTSQPGVSKQLKLLEEELGLPLFQRSGKSLTQLTEAGTAVLERAQSILTEVANIKSLSDDFERGSEGELTIATTHTQARYVLPEIITEFRQQWPGINFHLQQGTTEQLTQMLENGQADLAIASGPAQVAESVELTSCYQWHRVLLMPKAHPLAKLSKPISLEQLAEQALITYSFSIGRESSLLRSFRERAMKANVVLTARDADVIKTYVRLGMGIGLVAEMAVENEDRSGLAIVRTDHLFDPISTWVAHRTDAVVRGYTRAFINAFTDRMQHRLSAASVAQN